MPLPPSLRAWPRGASLVPVLAINRDQCPLSPSLRAWPRGASSIPVRGPTGTSFSPELLVPVGQPGLKAPTNRDNRGVCPLVCMFCFLGRASIYQLISHYFLVK